MSITEFIAPISLIVVALGGIFGGGWLKIIKETNRLLKEQNTELKIANKELLEKHNENIKQLSSMQGQIDVLKSIPLVNIDTTLQKLSEFDKGLAENIARLAETSDKILTSLETSAKTLATNTKLEVDAVSTVKKDLRADKL